MQHIQNGLLKEQPNNSKTFRIVNYWKKQKQNKKIDEDTLRTETCRTPRVETCRRDYFEDLIQKETNSLREIEEGAEV